MLHLIVTILLTICLAYCKTGGNPNRNRVDSPSQPKVDNSSGNKNQVETTPSNDNDVKQVAQSPQTPPVNQVVQPEQPKNMTPDLAAPHQSELRSVVTARSLTVQKPVVIVEEKPKKVEPEHETAEKKVVKGKAKNVASVHLATIKDKKESVIAPVPSVKHSKSIVRAPSPKVKEDGTQKTYLSADYNDGDDDTIDDAPSIKQGKDSKESRENSKEPKEPKKARTPVPSARSIQKKPPST